MSDRDPVEELADRLERTMHPESPVNRREHARHIAGEVLRAKAVALREALRHGVPNLLHDLYPRRKK